MKKLIFSTLLTAMSVFTLNAQEGLLGGGHFGAPIGNASDFFNFNYGANVSYLYPVMDGIHVGGKVGLDFYSGKNVPNTMYKMNGMSLLSLSASGQYDFTDQFYAGGDLGFALSLNNNYKGGFYIEPKGGWQNDWIQVYVFYKNISAKSKRHTSDDIKLSSISTFGVGANYKF